MIDFTDFAVFIGMVFLRVGVPALVIVAIGYGLKRLDRRWEAEANEYQAKTASERPAMQPEAPAPQPEAPSGKPGKQPVTPEPLPFIPPPPPSKEQRPGMYVQPGIAARHAAPSGGKAKCSTPSKPGLPCWQARFNAEGQVPEECVTCDIFQHSPSM